MISGAPRLASSRWRLARLGAVGLSLAAVTLAGPALFPAWGAWALMGAFVLGGAAILFALRTEDAVDERQALIVILLCAGLMRIALLFVEPYLSTDIYRYIWDGRVQASGINPYRYVPSAPELAALRDLAIYPNINRADYAVTIYPPVAQGIFLLITRLGESVVVMKLGMMAFEFATVAMLVSLLRKLAIPATRIVIYAWHPLPIWEIAGNGHVDAAMGGLLIAGLLLFLHGRTLLAGIAVTLGGLVKPTALLALAVFWKPWGLRLPLVVVATIAAAYLPYLSVGSGVFGFLWGYAAEEGITSGRGFNAIWLIERFTGYSPAGAAVYLVPAAMVMIATATAVAFRSDRSPLASIAGLNWLFVVFLILASPHYPWYFLVLVPLLVVRPSASAWVLTLASPLLYDSEARTGWPADHIRIAIFALGSLAALAWDVRPLLRKPLELSAGETP